MEANKHDLDGFFATFAGKGEANPWTAVVAMWRQIRAGGATWAEAVHLFVAMMADLRQQRRERGELE